MTIEAFAPAKINLTLHVVGQRADGYHLLDSVVAFADLGDVLRLEPGPQMGLHVTGPHAVGVPLDRTNLVWRAAQAAGWTGAIHLEKNLPHGAGIGGGSSDAAAVLRALDSDIDPLLLGADVPVCMAARAARMQGIGEEVSLLDNGPRFAAVLVNPGVHVATPDVFKALQTKTHPPMAPLPSKAFDWAAWLSEQRNDLEAPAVAQTPIIGEVLKALRSTDDIVLGRMSGSGATCFGLYPTPDQARVAATSVAERHPDWWCRATTLS